MAMARQFPRPNFHRPCKNAKCSSSVHGCPAKIKREIIIVVVRARQEIFRLLPFRLGPSFALCWSSDVSTSGCGGSSLDIKANRVDAADRSRSEQAESKWEAAAGDIAAHTCAVFESNFNKLLRLSVTRDLLLLQP